MGDLAVKTITISTLVNLFLFLVLSVRKQEQQHRPFSKPSMSSQSPQNAISSLPDLPVEAVGTSENSHSQVVTISQSRALGGESSWPTAEVHFQLLPLDKWLLNYILKA